MKLALATVACCIWFASCGDAGRSAASLVGLPCETSDECDVSGVCVTDGEGGLCALDCEEPGSPLECPYGAYCDRGEFTTDRTDKRELTLCLPSCKAQSECRAGYECTGVNGGPGKVCRPN
jgi:hypothetical protein